MNKIKKNTMKICSFHSRVILVCNWTLTLSIVCIINMICDMHTFNILSIVIIIIKWNGIELSRNIIMK